MTKTAGKKKSLREILNSMMCADCECLYESDIKLRVDQAIKEIQELCGNMVDVDRLLSLIDGASIAVELFEAKSPAQIEWRNEWLNNARAELSTPRLTEQCCCVCGFGEANIVICPVHSNRPENKPRLMEECPEKNNL